MANSLTLSQRMQALVGRTVNYQNVEGLILSWELGDHDLAIEYDTGSWHISPSQAIDVVTHWEETLLRTTPATIAVAAAPEFIAHVPTAGLNEVNTMLLDAMKRIEKDAGFIPQAKAMAETAQVYINVAKVQVEAVKLVVQSKRASR